MRKVSLRSRRATAISSSSMLNCLLSLLLVCPSSHVLSFTPIPAFSVASSRSPIAAQIRQWPALHVSSATADATPSSTKTTTEPDAAPKGSNSTEESTSLKAALPWSNFQEWALRDNLPHYLVSIPTRQPNGDTQDEIYGLWRTLCREVTELSGYSVEFLQEMNEMQVQGNRTDLMLSPKLLPLLDEFEFAAAGGLSGRVYGVAGLADGSKVETSSVVNVETTVPKGYVQTEDGSVAYELGIPLRDAFSLEIGATQNGARALSRSAVETAAGLAKGVVDGVATSQQQEDPDAMLVRLGASTALLLAGATAANMLSHHLTVNVFWV